MDPKWTGNWPYRRTNYEPEPPPPGLPQNREIITIIEAVTVAGDGIPLMTILK